MDGQKSKTSGLTATTADSTISCRRRIPQNYLLIWIDANIHESNKDSQNTLAQLRAVVNDVNIFTKPEQCIQFLNDIDNEKAFLITSGALGQILVPQIHSMSKLDSIYIFCGNKSRHEQWIKQWKKIKGVHTSITPICEALQLAVKQCEQDVIPISFVTANNEASNQDLNQLEPNFMYTQIFKDIFLQMEHGQESLKNLVKYCRKLYDGNVAELKITHEFKHKYHSKFAIWWYTRECFTYQMLNRALRTFEVDTIINMGFLIRDLHQQLQYLHRQQFSGYKGEPLIIYRGQGLPTKDFEKLYKTKGGLMCFNNFLSTSRKREVSLGFATGALTKTNMVGILFRISANPSVSSTPFAAIKEFSYTPTEEEILFSMNTVFRIGEIIRIDTNKPLYQVELTLTSDDDQQLRTLSKFIEEGSHGTGWQRIGNLLLDLKKFDRAEELYTLLLKQTSNEIDKAFYYNQLGVVKNDQGVYDKAISYYEKALQIRQNTLPADHTDLATSYNNIGGVYENMGDYSKALWYYEKDLEILKKTLSADHPDLATSYNNIGGVYENMGDYSRGLSFYEKALEIYQKTLPANHPNLATSYNNIAGVYQNMGQYSKALSFYEKAFEIRQKTLSANHPDLAQSYNNIGLVYDNMGEYSKALSFYEKALEINQKTLPENHPHLAISYNNIAGVYQNMGEYSKALSFYEKDLEIRQKTLSANHPHLATSYNDIGLVYDNMGKYPRALSFFEKALEIYQKTLPAHHPNLATSYNNIGGVYDNMKEYPRALSFYEKALEIRQKTLSADHPDLAQSYNNIAWVYRRMHNYSTALSLYERALKIRQRSLPPNHRDLKDVQVSIEYVRKKL